MKEPDWIGGDCSYALLVAWQWDKAIAAYSGALKCDGIKIEDLERGYSKRCAAFSRYVSTTFWSCLFLHRHI